MKYLFILFTISISALSCNKNTSAEKEVDIYLLKTYQRVIGKCQVDAATAVLEDVPAIRNNDIVAYSKREYWFELTNSGMQAAKTFMNGHAFAVTVDKQVIYYGIFKPMTSSSTCEHSITMDVDYATDRRIVLSRGYPGSFSWPAVDDQRNNPVLIAALSAQKKAAVKFNSIQVH